MTICSYTSGVFTWDENKRRANLRKHGVDFADAETIFAGHTVTAEDTPRGVHGTALRFARAASRCCGLRNVYRTSRQNPDYLHSKWLPDMKHASTSRKSRTDVKRLESRKDAAIVRDKDAPAWTPEMFARAIVRKGLKPVPRKTLLSLRIDADVLAWFRARGRGYQSRVNALLRAYMEAHK
jgi:uncharacterized protein (DUF4415 family)